MEAVKPQTPLEFKYQDLSVTIKARASSEDRAEFAVAKKGGDRLRAVVHRMVLSWRGFKRDGVEVPYSIEELSNVPDVDGKNFFMALFIFIVEKTDILSGVGTVVKND